MKLNVIVLLTLFISSVMQAQNISLEVPITKAQSNSTVDQRLGTGFLYSGYQALKNALPESKYKCAMNIYEQSLGLEEYQSVYHMGKTNAGIASYFTKQLNQNPCFAVVATQFTEILQERDKADSNRSFTHLLETAGKGNYATYPPGWVWQETLQFTNGDKNAALALIGLCGNEEMPSYSYGISGNNKVILAKKDLIQLNEDFKKTQKDMTNLPAHDKDTRAQTQIRIERIQSDIKRIQKTIQSPGEVQERQLLCPDNNSGFTVPKSLGEIVDIPQSLKAKIIKIQRPGSTNLDSIKAKYYHVTGSAFMGCQLAKCGISPDLAANAERTFAQGYRAVRLCGLVRKDLENLKGLSKKIGVNENAEDFSERAKFFLKAQAEIMILEGVERKKAVKALIAQGITGKKALEKLKKTTCDTVGYENDSINAYLCSASSTLRMGQGRTSADDLELDQKIGYLLREYDAAILFNKWYIGGGSILGVDIPCTGIRAQGPPELSGSPLSCKIKGWSSQRCTTAVAKLATWDVDFDWTKAQHEVGARFGASQCQIEDVNEPLDKKFCKILEDNSKKQLISPASGAQTETMKEKGVQ